MASTYVVIKTNKRDLSKVFHDVLKVLDTSEEMLGTLR